MRGNDDLSKRDLRESSVTARVIHLDGSQLPVSLGQENLSPPSVIVRRTRGPELCTLTDVGGNFTGAFGQGNVVTVSYINLAQQYYNPSGSA